MDAIVQSIAESKRLWMRGSRCRARGARAPAISAASQRLLVDAALYCRRRQCLVDTRGKGSAIQSEGFENQNKFAFHFR